MRDPQAGAPGLLNVRLWFLPWKFGFKSIQSIVKIEFTRRRPKTFWDDASNQYGFLGNVNPKFDHPRWSQATEVLLNTFGRISTPLYNGYEQDVAHLYDENKREFCY